MNPRPAPASQVRSGRSARPEPKRTGRAAVPRHHADESEYGESLAHGGFRFTQQRRIVFDTLAHTVDHPTAVQVFLRVKEQMPAISLATVYNCLETLSKCGLVRQVNVDREATRYCANQIDHGHFVCTDCGRVDDVMMPDRAELSRLWKLPPHYEVRQSDVSLRGLCPDCARKALSKNPTTKSLSKR
ncbi:MAG: transcriptional repressor [Verrucomicrobia bacterium]|nr:transcriptional repressor [Verrucomicrobiota bacterium]